MIIFKVILQNNMSKVESKALIRWEIFYIILILIILGCTERDHIKSESSVETKIVNLKTEEFDEYIGRGTEYHTHMLAEGINPGEKGWLGNPHPIGWCDICRDYHTRSECIMKFKNDFYKKINSDEEFRKAVFALRGKRLGCYCKPEECHGDIIKEWIDSQLL